MSEVWRDSPTCLKTCCSPRYYTSPCSSQKVKRGMKSKDESVQDNRKFNDGGDVNLKLPKWKATMARARSTLSDLFSSCVSHCFVSWSTSMNASGKSPFQELNFLQTKLCYLYIGVSNWEGPEEPMQGFNLFWSILSRKFLLMIDKSCWWWQFMTTTRKMIKTCPGAQCLRSPQGFHKQSTPEHWSFS